jgi:hypothetical protein
MDRLVPAMVMHTDWLTSKSGFARRCLRRETLIRLDEEAASLPAALIDQASERREDRERAGSDHP